MSARVEERFYVVCEECVLTFERMRLGDAIMDADMHNYLAHSPEGVKR
jgi:hypothetical protein